MQNSNWIGTKGAEHLSEPLGKLTSLTSLNLVRACDDLTVWWAAKCSGKVSSGDGRDIASFRCSGVERQGSMEGSVFVLQEGME